MLPCGGVEEVKVAPHGGAPVVSGLHCSHLPPPFFFLLALIKSNCLAAKRVPSSAAEVSNGKFKMSTFPSQPGSSVIS